MNKTCGNCRWHSKQDGTWLCANVQCTEYMEYTGDDWGCRFWDSRGNTGKNHWSDKSRPNACGKCKYSKRTEDAVYVCENPESHQHGYIVNKYGTCAEFTAADKEVNVKRTKKSLRGIFAGMETA